MDCADAEGFTVQHGLGTACGHLGERGLDLELLAHLVPESEPSDIETAGTRRETHSAPGMLFK